MALVDLGHKAQPERGAAVVEDQHIFLAGCVSQAPTDDLLIQHIAFSGPSENDTTDVPVDAFSQTANADYPSYFSVMKLLLDDFAVFTLGESVDVFKLDASFVELGLYRSGMGTVYRVDQSGQPFRFCFPSLDDACHKIRVVHHQRQLGLVVISSNHFYFGEVWLGRRKHAEVAQVALVDQLLRCSRAYQLLEVFPQPGGVGRGAQSDKRNRVPPLHPFLVKLIEDVDFINHDQVGFRKEPATCQRGLRTDLYSGARLGHFMVGLDYPDVCDALLVKRPRSLIYQAYGIHNKQHLLSPLQSAMNNLGC